MIDGLIAILSVSSLMMKNLDVDTRLEGRHGGD